MLQKILVPLDFSEHAEYAAKYALALALRTGAKLILAHVYRVPYISEDSAYEITARAKSIELTQQQAMTRLKRVKRSLGMSMKLDQVNHIEIECDTTEHFTVDGIIALTKKHNCSIVVMGTKGASGIKKFLLGSIASNVVEKSNVPVFLIPRGAAFKKIDNIAYATNFDERDLDKLRDAKKLADLFGAKLHCIHIALDEGDMYSRNKLTALRSNFEFAIENGSMSMEWLKGDAFVSSLNRYLKSRKIDVLCMLTHRRNIFQRLVQMSFTKEMSHYTRIPLVAFH